MLIGPGMLVALAARVYWRTALLAGPALTVGIIVVASTAAPLMRVPWSYPVVVALAALLSAAAWALWGRRTPRRPGRAERAKGWLGVAVETGSLGAAVTLIAWRCLAVFGEPEHVSQSYDNVFHLNALRYVLETGQASSLTVGGMTDQPYYPAGWHATVSAIGFGLGLDIPEAVNVVNTAVAAVLWPFGCVLLARSFFGRRAGVTAVASVAAASTGAFPLLMVDFGVLYPNLLAIASLPGTVALTWMAARAWRVRGVRDPRTGCLGALAIVSLAGTAASHPTTFMAWVVFAAAIWLWTWVPRARSLRAWFEAAAVAAVVLVLWWKVRPPVEAAFWGPYMTPPRALGELLLQAPLGLPAAWLLGALLVLGLSAFLRRGLAWWPLASFAAFAVVWIVIAGFQVGRLRDSIAGVWYNDSYRVAALLPVACLLVTVAGGLELVRIVRRAGRRDSRWTAALRRPAGAALAAIIAVVLAFTLAQRGGVVQETANAQRMYTLGPDSALISSDEWALLERLDDHVPVGTAVIGNPYTGAALSYALADRRNPQLHVIATIPPALQRVYDSLNRVATDPSVCSALGELGARYILDFGTREVHGGDHTGAGMRNLGSAPGLELEDSQGEARLYRVAACGG
jgi:hypothetical protein